MRVDRSRAANVGNADCGAEPCERQRAGMRVAFPSLTTLVLAVLVTACAIGCSGKANPNDPRSCPVGLPTVGGACEVDTLSCSYGASCGSSVKCASGVWTKSTIGCTTSDAGVCPTSIPRDGEPCTIGAVTCTYPCGDGGAISASCSGGNFRLVASGCALPM